MFDLLKLILCQMCYKLIAMEMNKYATYQEQKNYQNMDNLGSPEPALRVGHWKECLESLHLKSTNKNEVCTSLTVSIVSDALSQENEAC